MPLASSVALTDARAVLEPVGAAEGEGVLPSALALAEGVEEGEGATDWEVECDTRGDGVLDGHAVGQGERETLELALRAAEGVAEGSGEGLREGLRVTEGELEKHWEVVALGVEDGEA